ncbi:MAG: T9SS type A sorting domain-containing protein [candidate division Zixibacteria bacterium]|nr:T9SS type A sorting domain-containing protein [candidate division Zixibacteria bacterium]
MKLQKFKSVGTSLSIGLFLLSLFIGISDVCAETYVYGDQSGTWDLAGSPYIVIGDVNVANSLTIDPGVEVLFTGPFELYVTGSFSAIGNDQSHILFSSYLDNPEPGDWERIYLGHCGSDIHFEYCDIEYATHGLYIVSSSCNNFSPTFKNCEISFCSENGVYSTANAGHDAWAYLYATFEDSYIHDCTYGLFGYANGYNYYARQGHNNISLLNCIIRDCSNDGAHFYPGDYHGYCDPVFTNCVIDGCGDRGVYLGPSSVIEMSECAITDNAIGLERDNNLTQAVSFNDIVSDSFDFVGFDPEYGEIVMQNLNGDDCDAFFNIFLDPLFVDPGNGDFQLQEGSPCIDAGNPNHQPDPDNTIRDIGAFYFEQRIVSIDMQPDVYPIEVPAGSLFTFTGILSNLSDEYQTSDVWIMLELPGGSAYGPLQRFNNVQLAPMQTISVPNVTQHIPIFAPPGTYDYIAYCGDYPDVIGDYVSFEFTITDSMFDSGSGDWSFAGWFGENSSEIPRAAKLHQNYPNPFNAVTNINFDIETPGVARLEVYNLMGQKVATLVDEYLESGPKTATWDASEYSSGVYFYKLNTGDEVITKRMTLIK